MPGKFDDLALKQLKNYLTENLQKMEISVVNLFIILAKCSRWLQLMKL